MTRLLMIGALAFSLFPLGFVGYSIANPEPSTSGDAAYTQPSDPSTDAVEASSPADPGTTLDTTDYAALTVLLERQHKFLKKFHSRTKLEGSRMPAYVDAAKSIRAGTIGWLGNPENTDTACRMVARAAKRMLDATVRFASYPDKSSLAGYNDAVEGMNDELKNGCLA